MDAPRLKRARRRLLGYLLGSGVLVAAIYLCCAAAIISTFGLAFTSYVVTLVLTAAVLAGGTFAIIRFGALLLHVVRRVASKQPIMEIED